MLFFYNYNTVGLYQHIRNLNKHISNPLCYEVMMAMTSLDNRNFAAPL